MRRPQPKEWKAYVTVDCGGLMTWQPVTLGSAKTKEIGKRVTRGNPLTRCSRADAWAAISPPLAKLLADRRLIPAADVDEKAGRQAPLISSNWTWADATTALKERKAYVTVDCAGAD